MIGSNRYIRFQLEEPGRVVDHVGTTAIRKAIEKLTRWGYTYVYRAEKIDRWLVDATGHAYTLDIADTPYYAINLNHTYTLVIDIRGGHTIPASVHRCIAPLLDRGDCDVYLLTSKATEYTLYTLANVDSETTYVTFDDSEAQAIPVYTYYSIHTAEEAR